METVTAATGTCRAPGAAEDARGPGPRLPAGKGSPGNPHDTFLPFCFPERRGKGSAARGARCQGMPSSPGGHRREPRSGLSWQHLRGIPRSCGHSSGWEQPRSSPRVPRAAPGGDSGTSTTTQPCQERSHAGWGRTPCPWADPHSLLPLFHPSAGGKLKDRTRQLLQSMAAPIIPSWLTQKWFPSRLSPCRDSSVVSPPHVQHTGRPGRGSAARKSLAQGSYLLVHGLLGWLCSCMAAPLARLGTHLSLWSWHCRTMSPAAPNLRKNLIISPDTCLPGEPAAQADWGQEKAPKCQHILSL